jgi:hypothetical protein
MGLLSTLRLYRAMPLSQPMPEGMPGEELEMMPAPMHMSTAQGATYP